MTKAEKIMKSKSFIKSVIEKSFSSGDSTAIWERATDRLDEILRKYESLPKKVHAHTDTYIFPAAAIYYEVKAASDERVAYSIIEDSAIIVSSDAGRKLAKLMCVPGMKSLFVKIWNPMTKKLFGPESGFKNKFYPKKKDEYRMDVLACPYNRYFTELGCSELTKIFCSNDDRCYGNLPGLEFIRTGTIGRGADRCDFCIRLKK